MTDDGGDRTQSGSGLPLAVYECPDCETRLSSDDLASGPDHPEVGWEYYECPDCGAISPPEAVEVNL
jgi:DNA-directed RNA polymerase subunit RPC12/RpoP